MKFTRVVLPELLDGLDPADPAAQHSRRDLQRVHRVMGTRGTVLRALRAMPIARARILPLRVLELGAGDGSLMLGVARALSARWPAVSLTLIDRQPLLSQATVDDYAALGWSVRTQVADVNDWASGDALAYLPRTVPRWDLIVANLFLHHFQTAQLRALMAAIATRSENFFACEPRRALLAWAGSHLVGALGANQVTREDAVLSVHAGFNGEELSALWPRAVTGWTLAEYRAGLFSHCLRASHARATATEPR